MRRRLLGLQQSYLTMLDKAPHVPPYATNSRLSSSSSAGEFIPKKLVCLAEAALLVEGGVLEVAHLHADAARDVVLQMASSQRTCSSR